MVIIRCLACKKNLGHRKCEIFKDYIPDEVVSDCENFEKISKDEVREKLRKGINVYDGFSDVDD